MVTFDDVLGWDPTAIDLVLETAVDRADALKTLAQTLQGVAQLQHKHWFGEAGQAYQQQMRQVLQAIEADQKQSQSIAAAVKRAEQDVSRCRGEAQSIQAAARAYGWIITPDWQINVPNIGELGTVLEQVLLVKHVELLQADLNKLQTEANQADQELAPAINVSLRKPATIPTYQKLGSFSQDIQNDQKIASEFS